MPENELEQVATGISLCIQPGNVPTDINKEMWQRKRERGRETEREEGEERNGGKRVRVRRIFYTSKDSQVESIDTSPRLLNLISQ